MKWKALFDDGSTKVFFDRQCFKDICKEYVERLNIVPIFVFVDEEAYSLNEYIDPSNDIKIRVIHLDLPRVRIAATFSIGTAICEHIKHYFQGSIATLKEYGKGHFVIVASRIERTLLIKYIKKNLIKELKLSLNTEEEKVFHSANKIFGNTPDYSRAIELFSFNDLKHFIFTGMNVLDEKLLLEFRFDLIKDSLFYIKNRQKSFDHRKVGHELGIFYIKSESSPGMPYWLPDGLIIKNAIKEYLREEQKKQGFLEVETPIVGTEELYSRSGHLKHYRDDMFQLSNNDNEQFLRPMACPHHCDIYNRIPRTHKDLPLKLSEYAKLYRKESSGGLLGIERVTSMELSDAHIFCAEDDVKNQVKQSLEIIERVLRNLNIEIHQYTIAIRDYFDDHSYSGDIEIWKKAEKQIIELANEMKLNYKIVVGEAAFYGPKIDFEVISAHSMNLSTISTIQLDFILPKKFQLTYLDKDKKRKYVVMIHRGLASTFERLIAFMLTQHGGFFPLRFAPTQIEIIPISISSKKIINYVNKIYKKLLKEGFRVKSNLSEDTLSKKIRNSQKMKRNYTIIIGENEVSNKTISIRKYQSQETRNSKLGVFIKELKAELNIVD